MPEVLLSNDDITVLGPPKSIDVQIDIGPTGNRGSKVFVGSGSPNPLTTNGLIFGEEVYLNDLYINNATGSEYSYMFQYVSRPSGSTWIEVLKVNPAIYSLVETVNFTSGVGSIEVDIANITQSSGSLLTAEQFSIQFSIGNDEIVSAVITQTEITGVSDDKLTITFKAIKFDGSSWTDLDSESITIHAIITIVAVI